MKRLSSVLFAVMFTVLLGTPAVFSVLSLSGCVVTQGVIFDANSDSLSGFSTSEIEASDFFINVLQDFSMWKDNGMNDPVTDVAVSEFTENVSSSAAADNVEFVKLSDNRYTISFTFSDFEQLVADLCAENKNQNLLKVIELEGRRCLCLSLDLDNWDVLTQLVPFLAERNFEVWGPVYNNPPYAYMSADDYKELVGFILGEEGPKAIDESSVTIVVRLPSPVIATNGTVGENNTVVFSFPLIDFLLLHKPIVFTCEF